MLRSGEDDLDKVDKWLRSVLWHDVVASENTDESDSFEIHRTKGRLVLDSGEVKMIQGVREIFEMVDSDEKPCANLRSKIVLIGKNLSAPDLARSLEEALEGTAT